jgi:hypothetical protein
LSVFSAFRRPEITACRIPMAAHLVFFYSANMRKGLHLLTQAEHMRPALAREPAPEHALEQ